MRFATIVINDTEQAALACGDRWAPLHLLDESLVGDLLALIEQQPDLHRLENLRAAAEPLSAELFIPAAEAVFRPPYRRPHKIWGIGLNYGDHAVDLHESAPDQPASFIKGDHTIIGPGDEIVLPHQSKRTTAEAELGLVIGRMARDVETKDALGNVFGVCAILDQTAEDILAINPRYLTRAKNFPTFFSFGPEVVTLDEFLSQRDLSDVEVATVIDGRRVHRNRIGNMTHSPSKLVSFHSQMMPLYPGDLISTGTPGAGVLEPGVMAEAHIDGLATLTNRVRAQEAPTR